jgi:hypothetical protein
VPHIHSPRGRRALILAASASLALTAVATTVASADAKPGGGFHPRTADTAPQGQDDNVQTDLMKKQDAMRQVALQQRVKGKKSAQGSVVKLAPGQAVQLDREGTDKIFVVLVEFGDKEYPNPIFQGAPPDGSTTDVTGPLTRFATAYARAYRPTGAWCDDFMGSMATAAARPRPLSAGMVKGILNTYAAVNRDAAPTAPATAPVTPATAPAAPAAPITPGMYYGADGATVYRVQAAKGTGNLYAKMLGADGFEYVPGAIRKVARRMTLAEAEAYGQATGTCCVCARELTRADSIARGIGPVCASRV